ncbi:hypothetical protein JZ751_002933 [Albula glossodonta]|uniref:Uncharacterized protein n=1 Tax=Albula glossodonta TaxID=121402 RepID=A0A8T2N9I0_9TELE|nr:hypothetical protein JZ751_002933 [Albula glossodonta]
MSAKVRLKKLEQLLLDGHQKNERSSRSSQLAGMTMLDVEQGANRDWTSTVHPSSSSLLHDKRYNVNVN